MFLKQHFIMEKRASWWETQTISRSLVKTIKGHAGLQDSPQHAGGHPGEAILGLEMGSWVSGGMRRGQSHDRLRALCPE